jgi:hypothetical protein
MRRWLPAILAIACLAHAASPVHAQHLRENWHNFWHRVHTDFHRNNSWPEPFLSADRAVIREVWCLQADNGWKMQNTVGPYLFDENQKLNRAGELMVRWIVTQAPVHRRAVFVLKGETSEQTEARVASVNDAVNKFAAGGSVPPVLVTDVEPRGWSGSYVDAMAQQYQSSIPAPRLPSGGESSGGSGGGSSGGP